jgi:hypothetical protein
MSKSIIYSSRAVTSSLKGSENLPSSNFKSKNLSDKSGTNYSDSFLAQTAAEDPCEAKLVKGNVLIEEGSPAFSQSLRNKKKLEKLKQVIHKSLGYNVVASEQFEIVRKSFNGRGEGKDKKYKRFRKPTCAH